MRVYTFELVIHQGSDEFWDSDPSDKEVRKMVVEALSEHGVDIVGEGYEFATDTLTLTKFELK